ncbi:alpha/beta hydrolase [Vagococcus jeotgali]|uniref:alpha/beta hydrolase n=1 Tax=Vagococcus jeotgali TaxID=3109030 RepID=UPI002DDB2997|nr:alpha/beta hydrolase [Vagococcus sp. B2T-5]
MNIVGHSMGGVSGLRLLTQTPINSDRPVIKKFVAIGSPFNDFIDTFDDQNLDELLKNGPTEESERFILYQAEIPNMSKETEVLLIGGALSEDDQSDGTVPLSSALSVHHMLKNNGNETQYMVVEGQGAGHSALHENTEVDKKVSEFLYSK